MPTSTLYPPLAKKGLCNRRGKPPDTAGAAGQGACLELIIGDGGAFDGAPNEVAVQPVGQVAAIEPIGPLPQVAREVLGADTVMGADEPGFDVAEQCMDDWEERASVGAFVLDHGGVPEVFAEGGIAAAIAGEPVGQEVRLGLDIGLEEGAEFGAGGGRQHGDARGAGKEPVLTLDGVPVFSLAVLWRRHLLDGGNNQALVGIGRAAPETGPITAAADEGLVRLEKAAQPTGWIFAQPVAQLVRHGPGRLVGHHQFPLQEFGRDTTLVAAHQIGGKKPLREVCPRPMKHRAGGDRFLPVALAALVNPWTGLQPPGLLAAAPGAHKTAGPAKPGQVLDA